MTALPVDRLIETLVLEAVQPAALELSLRAAEQAKGDRERLHATWRLKVERANYEAERARRQYDAAEPDYPQPPIMHSSQELARELWANSCDRSA
jgi:hypothetical protein